MNKKSRSAALKDSFRATISRALRLGYGLFAQYGLSSSDTRFFHADMVGTTRMTTDSTGAIESRLRWTAFGEPLPLVTGEPPYGYEQPSGAQTRYGYAGSWGYQNDGMADGSLDIGLLHVGARYYDPAIGRFVMRDPAGVFGGLNVHTYVLNEPVGAVDPTGLSLVIGETVGLTEHAKMRMEQRQITIAQTNAALRQINAVVTKIHGRYQQLVAELYGDDMFFLLVLEGRNAGLIATCYRLINGE